MMGTNPAGRDGRTDRQIMFADPSALIPRARNPRVHSKRQLEQIAASIRRFGFLNPVLVDADQGIIAGHGRVEAAKLLGLNEIPTLRVDHLNKAEIRAYVIADNKLAENAGWDKALLALELREISVEIDLEITVTGFESAEIDILIDGLDDASDIQQETTIDRLLPAISHTGDLWLIGEHRLYCGDARASETYEALLGKERAGCIITDPPYNVAIDGHVSGLGQVRHREFAMAAGEMTPAEFTGFLKSVFENLTQYSRQGSLHYIFMDWRHMQELLGAGKVYSELKNLCVWAKTNAGMGSLYRSQHELVFVYKHGNAPHTNNVELGRFGRHQTNVWSYAGMNTFGKDRDSELAMHPTVKPLTMVADAMLDASRRREIVLDAFAGSGTTLLAAEKTGRRGYPHQTRCIAPQSPCPQN
jgi:hypothetical protein